MVRWHIYQLWLPNQDLSISKFIIRVQNNQKYFPLISNYHLLDFYKANLHINLTKIFHNSLYLNLTNSLFHHIN